jgi:hypothetical protein
MKMIKGFYFELIGIHIVSTMKTIFYTTAFKNVHNVLYMYCTAVVRDVYQSDLLELNLYNFLLKILRDVDESWHNK